MTLWQLRTVATQTMPLTVPGRLKPHENAAVAAYRLSDNCLQPAGGGRSGFPAQAFPEARQAELGRASCPGEVTRNPRLDDALRLRRAYRTSVAYARGRVPALPGSALLP